MKSVRCAIYTRKSSEEGLDQAFNSLDAQREACAAYILSQASEGWTALPDIYDDGGLSGGTLDRYALQRLLSEVKAGRVDIIVVYKVDRLTRSLLDFSKLVEAFDAAGTSFVSVTQSFNTTTSMGRLTLNMLLSFAQFEREVTAERIRDKIAASKAKGMWMGGTPPVGYEPDGRSLKIVEPHAAIVRDIFERYLRLGNVRRVAEELAHEGISSPTRIKAKTGASYGGVPLSRGQIYGILKCPTYIGEVHHRGQVYPGLHKGIVDRKVWDVAQTMLAGNLRGVRTGARVQRPSMLAGRVFDAEGFQLVPVHACKGKVRYRYYVSRDLQRGDAGAGMRIPARELEIAVATRVAAIFEDGLALASASWLNVPSDDFATFVERSSAIGRSVFARDLLTVRRIVSEVRVYDGRIEIHCSTATMAEQLGVACTSDAPAAVAVQWEGRLTRTGRAMRLVQSNGGTLDTRTDASLIGLIIRARRWWAILQKGEMDISALAKSENVQPSYVTRVLRLVFLGPAIIEAALNGTMKSGVDGTSLTLGSPMPANWADQRMAYLPACG